MRPLPVILLVLVTGCAHSDPSARAIGNTISRGGKFTEAVEIARRAGFELYDPGDGDSKHIQRRYGFCIVLPDDRALFVCHDPQADWIYLLQLIENWSGPADRRILHDLNTFNVPPARPATG